MEIMYDLISCSVPESLCLCDRALMCSVKYEFMWDCRVRENLQL